MATKSEGKIANTRMEATVKGKALSKMKGHTGKINTYDDASGKTKEEKSRFTSAQAFKFMKKQK